MHSEHGLCESIRDGVGFLSISSKCGQKDKGTTATAVWNSSVKRSGSSIAKVISGTFPFVAPTASATVVAAASVFFASSLFVSSLVLSDGFVFVLLDVTLGKSTLVDFLGVFRGEFLPLFIGDGEFSLFS